MSATLRKGRAELTSDVVDVGGSGSRIPLLWKFLSGKVCGPRVQRSGTGGGRGQEKAGLRLTSMQMVCL